MSEIPYQTDRHGGVFPEMRAFSSEPAHFGTQLADALCSWSAAGYRFVWLEFPPDATHYVGVGGVVINGRNELLVIKEKYFDGRPAFYKLPGGFVHPGEHLAAAVVREVWEETAVFEDYPGAERLEELELFLPPIKSGVVSE